MGEHVILMAEGRMVQSGPPRQVYDHPVTIRAAQVGNDPPINLIAAELAQGRLRLRDLADLPAEVLGLPLPEGRYTLGLRAHSVAQGGTIPARVALTEVSGSETVTHLQAAGQALVMLERTVTNHAIGATLNLALDLAEALVFDAAGNLIARRPADG